MDRLASSMANVMGALTMNSPACKATAIAAIEKDEEISENKFDEAVQLVMSNSDIANTYLAISRPLLVHVSAV